MKCPEIQTELPALIYGEVEPEQAARIEEHLASCPECRRELAALRHTRELLQAAPAPQVEVSLYRILQMEAEGQARRLRRWRRVALAGIVAAAAATILAIALNLEARLEAHQLVLRWGSPPTVEQPVQPARAPVELERASAALEAQLVILTQLAQGLTVNGADRDSKQRKEVTDLHKEVSDLRARILEIRRQANTRLSAIERDVSGLYAAIFGPFKKGATE